MMEKTRNWLIEHFISQAKIFFLMKGNRKKTKATRDCNLEWFLVGKTFQVGKCLAININKTTLKLKTLHNIHKIL